MSESALTRDSVIAVADHLSVADLGEEVFIFERETEAYYGLNEVGARIWQLIQQPQTVQAVLTSLLDEYEVDAAQCERDLFAFLDSLLAVDSIVVRNDTGTTP